MGRSASDWRLYRRLLAEVRPFWPCFVFSVIGYALYSFGTVLFADMMQFLLDALAGTVQSNVGIISRVTYALLPSPYEGSTVELARNIVPLAVLGITLLRGIGFFCGAYFIHYVARQVVHRLRCALFDQLQQLPSEHLDSHSHGTWVSKLTYNVEQVSGATTKALKTVVRESLVLLGLASYMLYLNWRLCLVFLAVAPLIALVVRYVGRRFRRYSRRMQDSMGEVTQVASQSLAGYREVRMLGAQAQQSQRFHSASADNLEQSVKLAYAQSLSTPVVQLLLALALAGLVWLALSPSIMAGFSAGSLVAFLLAAAQLGKPIRQLSAVQAVIQRGLAAAQDIYTQLDAPVESAGGGHPVSRVRGEWQLRDVSFTYPDAQGPAVHNVNLNIAAGETIALVGRSGSGKTTLTRLLARFYVPTQGEIYLDAQPLHDYPLENLRAQLSVVSQDVPIFRDTVYNNIAFGALNESSPEAVQAAAAVAHASEFIDGLAQGYDTTLGEEGAGLSGGQRQRIAIARAVLKDAPVFIFDEATSALDTEAEFHIQQALSEVMRDRTAIVIAHRLSTVEAVDRIVVMDAGRVVAEGSHQALLAQGGLYATLYHQAFQE